MGKSTAKTAEAKPGADGATAPKGKRGMLVIVMLVLGIALGGGGAAGYFLYLAPKPKDAATLAAEKAKADAEEAKRLAAIEPDFEEMERMTMPMIDQKGLLVGYMSMDVSLQIAPEKGDLVRARLPLIRHAFNEAMSVVSVGQATDPRMLDYTKAEQVLMDAANTAVGEAAIQRIVVVSALPV